MGGGWDIDRFYGQTSSGFIVGYGIEFMKLSSIGVGQKADNGKCDQGVSPCAKCLMSSVLQVSTGKSWRVGGGAIWWFGHVPP